LCRCSSSAETLLQSRERVARMFPLPQGNRPVAGWFRLSQKVRGHTKSLLAAVARRVAAGLMPRCSTAGR
jgi:hypothetical protein